MQFLGTFLREESRQHSADRSTLGCWGAGRRSLGPGGSLSPSLIWTGVRDVLVPTSVETLLMTKVQAKVASAAPLRHAGPMRAAACEASFTDTAEGTTCVHAPLALAQQPTLIQLSALVDVCKVGRQMRA